MDTEHKIKLKKIGVALTQIGIFAYSILIAVSIYNNYIFTSIIYSIHLILLLVLNYYNRSILKNLIDIKNFEDTMDVINKRLSRRNLNKKEENNGE